ncbi:MAG: DUF2508 family protein [Lactobacillaceae bacterium]|jgi:hypothetical protein|nr:DUF2508 family protein [Lactobacillaceae bacterium]
MIFGSKITLQKQVKINLVKTLNKLQDDYVLARDNEYNMINSDIDMRALHMKTELAKMKYGYLLKQSKKENNE